jgi:hypothetical protein
MFGNRCVLKFDIEYDGKKRILVNAPKKYLKVEKYIQSLHKIAFENSSVDNGQIRISRDELEWFVFFLQTNMVFRRIEDNEIRK